MAELVGRFVRDRSSAHPTSVEMTGLAKPAQAPRDPNFVFALAKGLEVLAAFSDGEHLGNQDLVQRTGLPKATVSRLTSTLVQLGYLSVEPGSRKFCMGARLLGMGASVQRDIGLHQVARPFMERLSHETQMTVSFGTRDRLGLVFLEVVRPPDATQLIVNTDVGSVLPLASTAIGLAYLVAAPVRERAQILRRLRERHAGDWDVLRANIERAHQDLECQGFVVAQRSWGRNVSAVGVPLWLKHSQALYAFHCAGPATSLPMSFIRKDVGPRTVATVRAIADAMAATLRPDLRPLAVYEP